MVSHDAPGALRRCVESVRRGTADVAHRLHVVDDASGRDTRACLRALAGSGRADVTLLPRNVGKAAAINRAVAQDGARADWYAVLDDDAQVPPGWLSGLLDAARRNPSASVLGCRVSSPDGLIYCAEMFSWFSGVGTGERDLGQRGYTRFCDAVAGVCLLIRGDALRELRFWEPLRQLFEDADFCYSARRSGRRVLYCGEVAVRHEHLARNRALKARNAPLMRAKWGVRPFADSHPLDRSYHRVRAGARDRDWEGVLRECRRLRRIDPVPAYAWSLAGRCHVELGRPSRARAAFERALTDRWTRRGFRPDFTAGVLGELASLDRSGYTTRSSKDWWRPFV